MFQLLMVYAFVACVLDYKINVDDDESYYVPPGETLEVIEVVPAEETEEIDSDIPSEEDCEPGPEICNGLDDDCDGLIESQDPDAASIMYHDDDDGDGFGAFPEEGGMGCDTSGRIPPGHARSADDCDDDDVAVNPTALEVEDGVDNNCDESDDL